MATRTQKKQELLSYGLLMVVFLALAYAYPALATEYQPLVGIPGLPSDSTRTLSGYVNIVYLLTVSIGALIAFVKITIAGVKYAMSDVITDKGEAKSDIKGALLGLAILLIPFLVLNTIYGGLVNLNILGGATPVSISTSPTGSGGVQVGSGNPTGPVATVYPRGTVVMFCTYDQTCPLRQCDTTDQYVVDSTNCAGLCSGKVGSTFVDLTSRSACLFYGPDNGGNANPNEYLQCQPGWAVQMSSFSGQSCKQIK